MCQYGTNRNLAGYRMGLTPTPRHHNPKLGVEKPPFQIAAKRLKIDENVNRARLIRQTFYL